MTFRMSTQSSAFAKRASLVNSAISKFSLEILHQNVEALMRQFHHSLFRESGYEIARDMVLDAESLRRLFI